MEPNEVLNIIISGGAGRIAYSLIPLICSGKAFGYSKKVNLRLLDIPQAEQKLQGVKMEIEDSGFENIDQVIVTTDPDVAFDQADIAILLGGFPRLPGMERRDLISKNVEIMRSQGSVLERRSKRSVKVLVVANPANTNCLVCMAAAPSIPKENFTSLAALDHERLKFMVLTKINKLLPEQTKLIASDLRDVSIFGNHSSTMVPYIDSASVRVHGSWQPVTSIITDRNWVSKELTPNVQTRGANVIKAQQLSSGMSAAEAVVKHLQSWLGYGVSVSQDIFSMGVLSDNNPYGVPDGLVFSFPCVKVDKEASSSGYIIPTGFIFDKMTQELMNTTVTELLEEKWEAEAILGVSLGGRF